MTLAEERDARSGRQPPEDPADEFNGTAAATTNDVIAQQAQFRAEDGLSSQQEKFKASVQRTSDLLDKLKEMDDKKTPQNIETLQKALGIGGQVFAQLAVTKKAQEGLKPIAGALQALQGISSMLIQTYLAGASQREMKDKIEQALEDTRAEMNKLGPALERSLEQQGLSLAELNISPARLAEAGYKPTGKTFTGPASHA